MNTIPPNTDLTKLFNKVIKVPVIPEHIKWNEYKDDKEIKKYMLKSKY
jgi:hypothetical protein